MAKNAPTALASIADYSDTDDDEIMEEEVSDPTKVVSHILEKLVEHVSTGLSVKSEPIDDDVVVIEPQDDSLAYRIKSESEDSDSDSSDSSSSVSSSVSSSDESSSSDEEDAPKQPIKQKTGPKTKGEMTTHDLPPIEDLHITVPEYESVLIGHVSSCVDDLVIVKSVPNSPAIDLESVLFLDKGNRPLGHVFDVIGPVIQPYYCVRFNSSEHIKQKDVRTGMEVYFAPRTNHTQFVFLDQLRQMKGSDASWKNDEEVPLRFAEFSDDEEERAARRKKKEANQTASKNEHSGPAKRPYQPPRRNQQNTNPFYRRNQRYDPREFGSIQWNHPHARPVRQPTAFPPNRYSQAQFMRPSNFQNQQYYGQQNPGFQPMNFSVPPPNFPQMQFVNLPSDLGLPPPPPPPPGSNWSLGPNVTMSSSPSTSSRATPTGTLFFRLSLAPPQAPAAQLTQENIQLLAQRDQLQSPATQPGNPSAVSPIPFAPPPSAQLAQENLQLLAQRDQILAAAAHAENQGAVSTNTSFQTQFAPPSSAQVAQENLQLLAHRDQILAPAVPAGNPSAPIMPPMSPRSSQENLQLLEQRNQLQQTVRQYYPQY